ncbi:hypothetical protein V1478_014275 [Vespula squamosa]|uniref:Uncharacterized protein n=1 Tax=Vespula squamosa TaxID=30214 RepID=A0ABD2A7M2_VESSQ
MLKNFVRGNFIEIVCSVNRQGLCTTRKLILTAFIYIFQVVLPISKIYLSVKSTRELKMLLTRTSPTFLPFGPVCTIVKTSIMFAYANIQLFGYCISRAYELSQDKYSKPKYNRIGVTIDRTNYERIRMRWNGKDEGGAFGTISSYRKANISECVDLLREGEEAEEVEEEEEEEEEKEGEAEIEGKRKRE